MTNIIVQGNTLVAGQARGKVISSTEMFSFWGGFNPNTGIIVDHHHPLWNVDITNQILVMPRGKGSSTGSPILVDAIMSKNSPQAIILNEVDEIIALGAIVCEQFFNVTIPIIVLNDEDFQIALKAKEANVMENGDIEFLM